MNIELPVPSSIPGILWPVIPTPMTSQLLSQLHYFSISEKFSESQLWDMQLVQLLEVINFARKTVPYYRNKFSHLPNISNVNQLRDLWSELPFLTRHDLQQAKETIFSEQPLPSHEPSGARIYRINRYAYHRERKCGHAIFLECTHH